MLIGVRRMVLSVVLLAVVTVACGLTALGLATAAPASSPPASSASVSAAPVTRVGTLAVHRCGLGVGRATYCGSVRVPLDYTDARAGTISIGFGWVPASRRTDRTVVAQEGGPGYPSTGTAPDYADMYGVLLDRRNLLVVDARGTGRSTPIDCEPLQSLPSPSPRFSSALAACGRQLDHTFRGTDGRWVHASDLFTTANSARDLARVLRALHTGRVDLYGDSYGTYFAQSFLARYPSLLRSVVLDSAYEARDLDPWYRTTVQTARRAFATVCRRAVDCPAPDRAWTRIGELTRLLRQHPVSGTVPDTAGGVTHVTVDVTALVNIVNDAGYDTEPYRQLDAAARAYLGHRDATPLLRLYAQDVGWDYSDYSTDAASYSDGLYLAVACTDYPQLFSMRATPAQRRVQLAHSIGALPADTFAPFTTREWLTVLPYTETYTGCLDWPAPRHPADPPVPAGRALNPGHIPVLIMNGELDSLTPAAGGAHIQRQLDSGAQRVVAANNVHLVALDSTYECGPSLVRRFVADPTRRLDTSCASHIPAIRAVPRFPATLAEAIPATGPATVTTRRLAAVAVAVAGDTVYRYDILDTNRDHGLRGGTVRYTDTGAALQDVRWTVDTSTHGTVTFTSEGATAVLTVRGPGGVTRTVHVSWGSDRHARVTVDGARLTTPAP